MMKYTGVEAGELVEMNDELACIALQTRIAYWQIQLQGERLTPLLRQEMQHAIKASSEALEQPNFPANVDLVKSLDNLHTQITKHWCKVFKNPSSRSILLAHMTHYEIFLTATLLEDYAAKPIHMPLPNEWFFDRASQIRQYKAAEDDNEDVKQIYQEAVVFPLEEMILNISHVEIRLCTAATARQAQLSYGYVSRLIQGCEWDDLAETLVHDRQLALNLFSHEPVNPEWYFGADMLPRLLREMDRLEHMYFTSLSGPDTFTISKYAKDLTTRRPSNSAGHTAMPSKSETEKHATQTSTTDRNRNISDTIKNGLRLLKTSLNLKSRKEPDPAAIKSDEKGPLSTLEDV